MNNRNKNSLRLLYLKSVFRPEAMANVVRGCEDIGFTQAVTVDGTPRDGVKTVYVGNGPKMKPIFARVCELSEQAGAMFGIEVWPKKLETIQVARYLPGDSYGNHVDHDTSLSNLDEDRKLSFFVACSPGGGIIIEGELWRCNTGDAIIFPSTMHHAAPEQKEGSRYSFVAWIPGPNWK